MTIKANPDITHPSIPCSHRLVPSKAISMRATILLAILAALCVSAQAHAVCKKPNWKCKVGLVVRLAKRG